MSRWETACSGTWLQGPLCLLFFELSYNCSSLQHIFLLCAFLFPLRMLLEKSLGERLLFSVTVSEQVVTLRYVQSRSQTTLTVHFRAEGRLALERWTHLVLQVRNLSAVTMAIVAVKTIALFSQSLWEAHTYEHVQLCASLVVFVCIQSCCLRFTIRLSKGRWKKKGLFFITGKQSLQPFLSPVLFHFLSMVFSFSQLASGNYTGKHLPWHSCWGQG